MNLRRLFRIVALVFGANGLLLYLVHSPVAQAQRNPQVDGLLTSCAQTMGSRKAEAGFSGEGEIRYSNASPAEHFAWKAKGSEFFRQEFSGADGVRVHVVNRGQGFHEKEGKRERLPFHQTAYFRHDYTPALACEADAAHDGMRVEYIGREVVEGQSVHHIRFSMAGQGKNRHADAVEELISEYHVFIDSATNRVAATRTWVFSPEAVENRSIWETIYSDYRDVDGILMPFHIQNRVAGQPYREVVLSSVRINANISEKDFQ